MKENNFFEFGTANKEGCLQGNCEEIKDKAPIIKGELDRNEKYVFEYDSGSKVYDTLYTGWILTAVSKKITDILEANNFIGWKKYEADFYDKKGNLIEGYSLLGVTGRAGKLDRSLSEKIYKESEWPFIKRRNFYKGLYFEEGTWDGSDIFMMEDNYSILITEKVYKALKKAKLTNVQMIPISEYETLYFEGIN